MSNSERWFCSDHHFFHKNVLKFQSKQRPFDSVEEMNEIIIERHNSVVKPSDVVYLGGDVVFGGITNLQILSRLNGTLKLIIGNHDNLRAKSRIDEYLKYFDTIDAMREFGDKFIIYQHYPVHPQQLERRYILNVHGHLHSNEIRLDDGSIDIRYCNVCIDNNNLYPTPYKSIVERVNKIKEERMDKGYGSRF